MLFKDCICFQLGKTVRTVTRAYRREIAEYKLTHGQFFMMVAILEQEGLLPSELADKTSQDRATTTGLLDRLEKEGWIRRRPDDTDRRSMRIFLTPHARDHREGILTLFRETNQKFLDCFSPDEWAGLQALLNRLDQYGPAMQSQDAAKGVTGGVTGGVTEGAGGAGGAGGRQ